MTALNSASGIEYKFHADKRVSIITCPFSGGQGRYGVELGPDHVLEHGLAAQLEELSWTLTATPTLTFTPPAQDPDAGKLKRPQFVADATRRVAESVAGVLADGVFPLVIGGDHSLAIGTISGMLSQHPDACLLWIDAHADINTPDSTPSGNIHGCPVAFVAGLVDPLPAQFSWLESSVSGSASAPRLPLDRLAYIGLRDVDSGERAILRQHNVAAFSMHHIDKYGIGKVVEMALARINPTGKAPVYVSFDIDALDPEHAPATGTPVRGGLSLREACYICEAVAETGNLLGMDVMECNPVLGTDERSVAATMSAACSVVRCAMGETLL
ncbi:uncharacterized protein V1518DRAFT_194388 [Limtongia smithiae]|uniref:uncharacterized protein n=1 Tax=Limtongia smithiae TaxID=1125753 RepID=UPI0034CFBD13